MRKFALCSSSLALVFAFMVLAPLSVFAEDSIDITEGYNLDCVPYSPFISSIMITDNLNDSSFYYSSLKARTYSSTSSTFSVSSTSATSDTSTDYLYSWSTFHDIYYGVRNSGWSPSYLIYSPDAGGNIANPYYTLVSNTTIRFNGSSDNHPDTSFSLSLPLLKVGNKYRFSFTIKQPNAVYGVLTFGLVDSANSSNKIDLCSFGNSSTAFARCDTTISGDVIIPDTWSGTPKLVLKLSSWSSHNNDFANKPPVITLSNISFIDVTNENLDKSLDKFGDRIDSIINPSEPYSNFDDGSFQGSADELKNAENSLPSVNHDEFQSLANSIDLSEYSNAFAQINNLFVRFVDTVGITPLIFFALFFGICIFILGRKLSGG